MDKKQQTALVDALDERFRFLVSESLNVGIVGAVRAYVDHLSEIRFEDPAKATFFADLVPALVSYLEPDEKARAFGIASAAHAASSKLQDAFWMLDKGEAHASDDVVKAELYARRAKLLIRTEKLDQARRLIAKGRALAERGGSNRTLAWLDVQSGGVAMNERKYADAFQYFMRALWNEGCDERIRQAALANVINVLSDLHPRTAYELLQGFYTWKRAERASFADYVLAWLDGRLRARMAETHDDRRAARSRLRWVAEGLHRMGRELDAALAVLDLVTLAYRQRPRSRVVQTAAAILGRMLESPQATDELRRRVRRYLDDPTHPVAVELRTLFIEAYGDPFRRSQRAEL